MDKVTRYRNLIKGLLNELAEPTQRNPKAGVDTCCVFDEQRDHYLLMSVGWSGKRRVRSIPVYIRLKGGKIWVEDEWTDARVVDRMVEAGVPKEDIVLAFHPPAVRELTEFAVA